MAELLFIATTIFVAYVLFDVLGRKKDKPEIKPIFDKPITKPSVPTQAAQAQATTTVIKTAPKPAKPAVAKATPKPEKAPAQKTSTPASANTLKNPKTGEVARLPNNYAFAKRWIKEALVEEGLLDKIYKNNELDAHTTEKTREAIQQLKAMDKYN